MADPISAYFAQYWGEILAVVYFCGPVSCSMFFLDSSQSRNSLPELY
ncbi:MAG: hypothetical protein ACLQEQ_00600 [Nitrososphaerales archaeon]